MSLNTSPSLRIPHAILIAALLVGFAGIAGMIVSIWKMTSVPASDAAGFAPPDLASRSSVPAQAGVWRPLPGPAPASSDNPAGAAAFAEPQPPPILISEADAASLHEQQIAELRRQAADPDGDPDSRLSEERIARMEAEGLMAW